MQPINFGIVLITADANFFYT